MFKEGEIVCLDIGQFSPYLISRFVGYFGSQNNILQFDVIVKDKNGKPQKTPILCTEDEARRCLINVDI